MATEPSSADQSILQLSCFVIASRCVREIQIAVMPVWPVGLAAKTGDRATEGPV